MRDERIVARTARGISLILRPEHVALAELPPHGYHASDSGVSVDSCTLTLQTGHRLVVRMSPPVAEALGLECSV